MRTIRVDSASDAQFADLTENPPPRGGNDPALRLINLAGRPGNPIASNSPAHLTDILSKLLIDPSLADMEAMA